MKFTLVSTVFNEAHRLAQTISDLENQSLPPTEIVITDAGSTDGTYELLLDWRTRSTVPVIVLQKHKCNVAQGRNIAIKAAQFPLIASTDFGCRFHKDWLRSIIEPFSSPLVDVIGGSFSVEESEQTSLAARAAYLVYNGYAIDVKDPSFIPSSRSIAYRREVFDRVGGYCEWLTLAADDLVFGKEIKARGYTIIAIDKPYVYWGRHKSLKGYVKEATRYGLGDGEARVNQRNFIVNTIYLGLRIDFVLFALIAGSFARTYPITVFLPCLLCLSGFKPYLDYTKAWLRLKSAKYNTYVFLYGLVLLEATRFSYIKAFIRGYLFSTENQRKAARSLKERLVAA